MPRPLAALSLAVASACAGPPLIVDERPDYVPDAELRSVRQVLVSEESWRGSGTIAAVSGSAVIVGPNQLLTNAHLWSRHEVWSQHELEPAADIVVCHPQPVLKFHADGRIGEEARALRSVSYTHLTLPTILLV